MGFARSLILPGIFFGLTSCGNDPPPVAPSRQLWLGGRADGLVYFEKTGKVLLLNGGNPFDPMSPPLEIWEWTGTEWNFVSDDGPPARLEFATAYDSRREVLILYGGWARGPYSDLWEWNGSRWNRLDASELGVRRRPGLAYDEVRQRTILFGGYTPANIPLGDTWSWDGHAWTLIHDDGPPPRAPAVMSYDYKAKKILMYGGYAPSSSISPFLVRGDAWYLEDYGWKLANSGKDDLNILDMAAVFNFSTNSLISIGGNSHPSGSSTALRETLGWDQSVWVDLRANLPAPRYGGSAAYDKTRSEIILVGGSTEYAFHSFQVNNSQTWVWDGTSWHCPFGCNE